VARGNITAEAASRSVLMAGGKVTLERKPVNRGKNPPSVILEKEPNPLGFITFFELHRIGLEVKVADGVVRVAKVAPGFASAKAGLKVGDVVLDVGGKKPTDAETLRRLLRDALAIGDATVKLKRGNDTLTVKLTLPE
jgi:S1-C subfamily serine protease